MDAGGGFAPDIGLGADEIFGFDSHAIIRRSPRSLWTLCENVGGWRRFTRELVARDAPERAFHSGATFRIGVGMRGPLGRLGRFLLPAATVISSSWPDEVVWETEYYGLPARHGMRFESYWHEDEDENAPATSSRLVHSLAVWGVAGRAVASLGLMRELENRFHRFNADLARYVDEAAQS